MMARFTLSNMRLLVILATYIATFSTLSAQENTDLNAQTEQSSPTNKSPKTSSDARKTALESEKNANDLRKITLLLAIAQDRDRQAAESMEDIRSRRLRIEEDLLDAEDNPNNFSKKQRADLDLQLKSLQKKEKLALKARENANNFLLDVTQAVASEPSKRAKFIGTYERKFGPVNDSKSVEMPVETLATTDRESSKLVANAEKAPVKTPMTPSVQTPIFSENMPENVPDMTISTSKRKKEPKAKQNESPKKVVEKTSKKAVKKTVEPAKTTEDFPVVFNETPPVEPSIEAPKVAEKTSEKGSKKKASKSEKPKETVPKTDDFPLVLTDAAPNQTPPPNAPIIDNAPIVATEIAAADETKTAEIEVKSRKKSSKSDKKSKKIGGTEVAQGSLVSYQTYEKSADVFMNSPAPDCNIAYEGKDEFTGKMKRETMPARFFTHTDDIMRKALMDKDFITCDIAGTKVESSRYTYLNMTFTILSEDIQRTLGFLDRGTPIIFVLVNGGKITLHANKTDIGVVDIDKGTTTYRAQLTTDSITDMTGSEIDYVRVNWSSGYEDYEVFDVDILKNLFNCLYKK